MPRLGEIDDETRELVARILSHAGAMMEDASVLALLSFNQHESISEILGELERASSAIGKLIGAARVLADG